jgi:hypothetical protein
MGAVQQEVPSSHTHTDVNVQHRPPIRKAPSRKDVLKAKRDEREKKEKQGSESALINRVAYRKQIVESLITNMESSTHISVHKQKRCTYEAIAMGLHIIKYQRYSHGRMFIFTNACASIENNPESFTQEKATNQKQAETTFEGKSIQLFHHIGKEAWDERIGLDVFFSGVDSIMGAPTFLSLVESSCGYVMSYTTFLEENFLLDFSHIARNTFISGYPKAAKKISTKEDWNMCILDIRMSRCVCVE